MSPKETQGLINALVAYLVIGGFGTGLGIVIVRTAVKDATRRLPWYLGLALAFLIGMALWLWLIRNLQHSFN